MRETSDYSEVKIEHIDDNGVAHIDSFKTLDDNEEGKVLGYIMNGEIYWKNDRAIHDPLVVSAIADYLVEWRKGNVKMSKDGDVAADELSDFVNNFG